MKKKFLLLILSVLFFAVAGIGLLTLNHSEQAKHKTKQQAKSENIGKSAPKAPAAKNITGAPHEHKKAELYSSSLDKIPMSSIQELSDTDTNLEERVNAILENSQSIYFVKKDKKNNQIVILSESYDDSQDKYSRHNLLLTVVSQENKIKHKRFGYDGLEGETDNAVLQKADVWVYDDSEPLRPMSHTVYGHDKKIVFTEHWNYSDDEPVKYELKNGEGKTISLLKETVDNNVNFRKEHIFYDKDGNIEMSISASYEGADLKRLNYYNAESVQDSFMIENNYENGLKTEEKVYNGELQLVETIKADYDNGELKKLQINDAEGNELEVIEQKN